MIGSRTLSRFDSGGGATKRTTSLVLALGFVTVYGAAMATPYSLPVTAATLGAISLGISLVNWRVSYLILLAYLPYSGVASVVLYPNSGAAALVKDVALVLPLYVGFVAYLIRTRRPLNPTGRRTWYLAFLAGVVFLQAFNPALPNQLVALVGIRVWLLYVPIVYLTAHFVWFEARGLETVLRVVVVSSLPVAVLGILQALLLTVGLGDLAYAVYGPAGASITQQFAAFEIGSGTVRRVASTLPFAGQYFGFTLAAIAISYAYWRHRASEGRSARLALVSLCVFIVAALTSGSRGAFLLVPTLLLLTAVLDGVRFHRFVGQGILLVALLAAATASFGISGVDLVTHLSLTAATETQFLLIDGLGRALPFSIFGLGTGADTSAARHVIDGSLLVVNSYGNGWFESWYLKALVELGFLGFIAVAGLVTGVIRLSRSSLTSRSLDSGPPRSRIRGVAAPLAAFLLLLFLYNLKGGFVDIDPINVEFWVVLGVLLALVPANDVLPLEDSVAQASLVP